jgi:hypothetical protein
MSLSNNDQPKNSIGEDQGAPFETKIPALKDQFYFHQLTKESAISRHYIIEDISNLAEQTTPIFYYLKQSKYPTLEEHQFAKRFYGRFHQYCHSRFLKNDIAKLQFIFHHESEEENYHELVTVFEYGDSDRIDVDNIEADQVLRFLRNICLLLEEVQKFNNLAHGNIFLKNMVLSNNELKLSGFKPILQTKDTTYKSWKVDLARKFGAIRLDIYLVGLMWMKFVGIAVDLVAKPTNSLEEVMEVALEEVKSLPNVPKLDLLYRLIDISENPVLSIDGVISEFDEYFIMEEIRAKQEKKNSVTEVKNDHNNSSSFSHVNFNNGDNSAKMSNFDESRDEKNLKKSESKMSNPFTRMYKDSEHELSNKLDDHKRLTVENANTSLKNKNSDFMINGGEYSLKPKESFGDLASFQNNKIDQDSLSDINFDTRNFLDDFERDPNGGLNKANKVEERYSSLDPNKESLQRNTPTQHFEEGRKMSFDDLADGKRISFRNTNFNNGEVHLKDSMNGRLKGDSDKNIDLLNNSLYHKYNSDKHSDAHSLEAPANQHLLKKEEVRESKAHSKKESLKQFDNSKKKDSVASLHAGSSKKLSIQKPGVNDHSLGSSKKITDKELTRPSLDKSKEKVRPSLDKSKEKAQPKESIGLNKEEVVSRESKGIVPAKPKTRDSTNRISNGSVKKESIIYRPSDGKSIERISIKTDDKSKEKEIIKKDSIQSTKSKEKIIETKKKPSVPGGDLIAKQSITGRGMHVENEIQNRLSGNKNSISNQILANRGENLKATDSFGPNKGDSKVSFSKKSIPEKNDFVQATDQNKRISTERKESNPEMMRKQDSYALITESNTYPARNPSSGSNKKQSQAQIIRNKPSIAIDNSDLNSKQNKKNSEVNNDQFEKTSNSSIKKSVASQNQPVQFSNTQNSAEKHRNNTVVEYPQSRKSDSNSPVVKLRAKTDQSPYKKDSIDKPIQQSINNQSIDRTNLNTGPMKVKSIDKNRKDENFVLPIRYPYEDIQRLSQGIHKSESLTSKNGIITNKNSLKVNQSEREVHQIQESNSQSRLVVNPKLLRPSKSIGKSLGQEASQAQKSFTNLDKRVVERSPLRKKKLEELKQAELEKSPLAIIRSKIRDALKVELSDSQKQEILRRVQQEQEEELKKKFYISWQEKEKLSQKMMAKKIIDEELENNIHEISKQKMEYKKMKDTAEFKKHQADERVASMSILEKEYQPVQALTRLLQKNQNPYDSHVEVNGNDVSDESSVNISNVAQKRTNNVFEEISKKASRQFKLSPIHQRDKFFTYNHDHEVLKIPFRKVVEDFQRPINEEIANLKNQIDQNGVLTNNRYGSESKSRGKTLSAKAINKDNEMSIHNYFFKNQLKNQMDEFPALQFLKPNGVNSQSESLSSDLLNRTSSKLPEEKNQDFVEKSRFIEDQSKNQNFIHMNENPEILVNEMKSFSIYSPVNAFVVPKDVLAANPKLLEVVSSIKKLYSANNLSACHKVLEEEFARFSPIQQVEVEKLISFIYFAEGDIPRAKKSLMNCIQGLKQNRNSYQNDLYFSFIVINLAFLEFYNEEYDEAIEIMNNEVFKEENMRPYFYNNFLGSCHYMKENFPAARDFYNEQLKIEFGKDSIEKPIIGDIIILISKILNCVLCENEKIAAARFFQSLEPSIEKLISISNGFKDSKFDYLKNLSENLVLIFLRFGHENSNGGLLNFILQRSFEKKLMDPFSNLSEEQKTEFCTILLYTCNYLKAKTKYGNFEKNFVRYLDIGKKLISSCDLTAANLKLNLFILFHKGIYLLQSGQADKSEAYFDKCMKLYGTFFDGSNIEVFEMLFKIGLAIISMNRDEQASYFFEKILALKCPSEEMKIESKRQLAKIYFRLGKFTDCTTVTKSYLEEVIFKCDNMTFGEKIFKDICMLFVANEKSKLQEFSQIQEMLINKLLFSPKVYLIRYIELFNSFKSLKFKNLPQKNKDSIWLNMSEVFGDQNIEADDQLLKLIAFATTSFKTVIDDSLLELGEKGDSMLNLLKEKDLGTDQNLPIIHQFVFNFVFMLIHLLPKNKFKPGDKADAIEYLDSLHKIRINEKNKEIFHELLENFKGCSVEDLQDKINQITKFQQGKQSKMIKIPSKENSNRGGSFELPVNMIKAIEDLDIDREFCKCSATEAEEYGVTMLIEQFLRQIKNMLFLDVYDNLSEYYRRFELIIAEKNWNWTKFEYVKKLFDFYLLHEQESTVNKASFVKILDHIFENSNLCLHDLKLIVLLLESFKNIEYIEVFIAYVDRFHPITAAVIFNVIFLKSFSKKRSHVVSSLYKKIYNYRFYHLDNYPLMHCINIENALDIEKDLEYRIYVRNRYDCMANPKFKEIFYRYISPETLMNFNFEYSIYKAIVFLLKKPHEEHASIIQIFQNKLAMCHNELPLTSISHIHYFYDLFLVIHLVDYSKSPEVVELVSQILHFIEEKVSSEQLFHFAVVCSITGNIFCKFKHFEMSIRMKLMSLTAIKRLIPGSVTFPQYMIEIDLKNLIFGILSFLVVNYLELQCFDEAEIFLSKLIEYKFENGMLDLEKLLVNFLFELKNQEISQAAGTLDLVQKLFEKMQLNEFLTKMFRATIDRMLFMVAKDTETPQQVERKRLISEASLVKLFTINK